MNRILTAVFSIARFKKWGSLTAAIIIAMSLSGCLRNSVSETTSSPTTSSIDNKADWTSYTDGNTVGQVLAKGNDLWAATEGGAVEWNMTTGTYQKYTTLDGLISNYITGAAQDKQGRVSSIALARRQAFHAAETKQFDQAVFCMQKVVNETSEPKMKGWLKQELAEYKHYQNPAESQEILKSALSFNDHLLKPISGITYSKLAARSFNQASQCASFLAQFKNEKNIISVSLNANLENLQYEVIDPKYFEQAINDLAQYVGFNSQQPELKTATGTDVLWEIGHNNYLIIACKNCAESPTISKRYCDELSGSVNWFKKHYEGCKYVPVMIHPSKVVDHLGSPVPEMRVIDTENLNQLKRAIQIFISSIISSDHSENIDAINDLLFKYNLTAEKFIQNYSVSFEMENIK